MKNIKYKLGIFLSLILIINSCQEDNYEVGELITPTNVKLDFNIVGQDNENLFGDGSGKVNFTASADNAITYKFIFGDGCESVPIPTFPVIDTFDQSLAPPLFINKVSGFEAPPETIAFDPPTL